MGQNYIAPFPCLSRFDYEQSLFFLLSSSNHRKDFVFAGAQNLCTCICNVFSVAQQTQEEKINRTAHSLLLL